MNARTILWVVEFRESPRYRWEFEAGYETRQEAKDHGWEAVPPAEHRIVKYVREEPKGKIK